MNHALVHSSIDLPVPVGDLDQYIARVGQIPVLDHAEESRLALLLRDDKDLDAARRLILHNLRFVVHVARGYLGYGLPLGDLIQEGNIGLMKSVRRFDPDQGVRLVSFAVHWIRAEIHEFILRNWRIVKVATTKAQRKLFFNLRQAKRHLGWLNPTEVSALARDLGVSEKEVLEMENRLAQRDASFDPTPDDDDPSPALGPSDLLTDGPHNDPAYLAEEAEWGQHTHTQLHRSLQRLDERSRDILARRYLSENKATLQDLAAEYGVSAERIRQIENNAFKNLRQSIVL